MKLRTRMILCMAFVLACCVLALGLALAGMQSAKSRFITFVDVDQQILQNATGLYAEGLQIGQALRNIVLDPKDGKAVQNLDVAVAQFNTVLGRSRDLRGIDSQLAATLQGIAEVQAKRQPVLKRTAELALQDQGQAAAYLRTHDTPAWREMRAPLLKLIKTKTDAVAHTKAEVVSFTQQMFLWSLVVAAAAIVLGLLVALYLTRFIMRQLGAEPRDTVEVTRRIAQGDLASHIDERASREGSLVQAISVMQSSLSSVVTQVRAGAESIAAASRQIAAGNTDLSSRTEEQASSLQETAASMEQLTATVKQNGDNAHEANQLAIAASEVAVQGGAVVKQLVDMMDAIHQSSSQINDIIGVIDSIAFQTNILALNAAVEAARAGEQGRGFAVVASEVRSLAQRSATSAKEIKALIDQSVSQAASGASLAGDAGNTMHDIVTSVQRVASIVNEISLASTEQTAGIEQVNQAVVQMEGVTQQNAALVEEAAAASTALQDQAADLERVVAIFRVADRTSIAPLALGFAA